MGLRKGQTAVGICIEGGALAYCLMEHCHSAFLELCNSCRSVVCCRVSPMQKAQVNVLRCLS
jgi:phospholipid-transporting ATPase